MTNKPDVILDWLTYMYMHPENWELMYPANEIELLAEDALEMLKPVQPIHKPEWRENYYVCGNCGGWITKPRKDVQEGDNYCSRCGREIQWND